MRRRSGQKGDETAKCVESCKNRRVMSARTVEFCKTRRVLQNPPSSAITVESCKTRRVLQEPSSPATPVEFCKNRRVLQNPSNSAKPVEQDSTDFAVSSPFWPLRRLIGAVGAKRVNLLTACIDIGFILFVLFGQLLVNFNIDFVTTANKQSS